MFSSSSLEQAGESACHGCCGRTLRRCRTDGVRHANRREHRADAICVGDVPRAQRLHRVPVRARDGLRRRQSGHGVVPSNDDPEAEARASRPTGLRAGWPHGRVRPLCAPGARPLHDERGRHKRSAHTPLRTIAGMVARRQRALLHPRAAFAPRRTLGRQRRRDGSAPGLEGCRRCRPLARVDNGR